MIVWAEPSRGASMAAFDALPREVRDAINYGPVSSRKLPLDALSLHLRGAPPAALADAVKSGLLRACPGWRPLRGESGS